VLAAAPGKRILVLGDMGELGSEGRSLHKAVGKGAKEAGIDALLTLGELSAAAAAAFAALVVQGATLGAHAGNLERLSREYRKTMRRARALSDVLLPELDRTVADIETRLEELEQEDAILLRSTR
jgi:UDP-N-acetylmuramyl pentapeptide synthase